MPPSRTSKRQRPDAEEEDDAADRPVGVNKLKSQIRQTKRLLASDRITPDIRQETERRLVALELDLETAERKKVETSRAARYHRVKFFGASGPPVQSARHCLLADLELCVDPHRAAKGRPPASSGPQGA